MSITAKRAVQAALERHPPRHLPRHPPPHLYRLPCATKTIKSNQGAGLRNLCRQVKGPFLLFCGFAEEGASLGLADH